MLQLLLLFAFAWSVAASSDDALLREKRLDSSKCAWGKPAVTRCFPAKPPDNLVPFCSGQYKCDQAINKCCLGGPGDTVQPPVQPLVQPPVQPAVARASKPDCTVGEPPSHDNEPEFDPDKAGICNYQNGNNKCADYCRKRFGKENIDSRCVDRSEGIQECTCINYCCTQGCWGDPHCYTCDGTKFGYRSLEKYWVIKPCTKYTTIPNFEILQTNRVWGSGPMAVLNTSELVIPEWNTKIEVITPQTVGGAFVLKVNETVVANSLLSWKVLQGYTANTIDINFVDATKSQLVIQTSFGVKMTIAVHFSGSAVYSDITIDTPRIPELKGKMCGLIGRWSESGDDDGIDANGKRQPLDEKFSCAFGNSWRVPGKGVVTTCTTEEQTTLIKTVTTITTKIEITTVNYIQLVCSKNLELIAPCMKQLGLPSLSVDDCVTDSLLAGEVSQMLNYVQALLLKYQVVCHVQIIFIQPPLPTPPPTPAPTPGVLTTPVAILPPRVPPTCDFGEFDSEKTGQCNSGSGGGSGDGSGDGDYKCMKYCKTTLGADMVDAVCVDRGGGSKECICRAKCCNQGCGGDPHCWTCDGAKFGYQGLKEHYLLMPWKKFSIFPSFEIRLINTPWARRPMSRIYISKLVVSEWDNLAIEIKTPVSVTSKFVVSINDKAVDLPYRWTKTVDFRLRFVDFSFVDARKTQLLVVTSFGLRVMISVHYLGNWAISDLSIDFPRHPDLKDKIAGLLGHWNGDIRDEGLDFSGVKRPLDAKFSAVFGNSWIVKSKARAARAAEQDESEKEQVTLEAELKLILDGIDNGTREFIQRSCRENLLSIEGCVKDLGRPNIELNDCVVDALTMTDANDRLKYVQGIVEKFSTSCNIEIPFIETKCCMKSLNALYRLYSLRSDSYVYTTDSSEAIQLTGLSPVNPYRFEGSPGDVAMDPNDCGCNLQPVYRLYRYISGKEDHLYTTDSAEASSLVASKKYYRQGIPFYCAPVAGKCGAQIPLRRYSLGLGHFYTASEAEANANVIPKGGKFENILCYIWPTSGTIHNDETAAKLQKEQSGISPVEINLLRENNEGLKDDDLKKITGQ